MTLETLIAAGVFGLAFDRDGDDGPWNLVTVNTVAGPGTGDPITVPEQPPKSIRMWH